MTNEQVRNRIAKWLLEEGTAYRSKARISERKRYAAEQNAKADALMAAGQYVLGMKVE